MAGLLDYDPQAAKQQALYSGLLGMGAQLLANSGRRYSTTPGGAPGLGAALGQGLLGFQQGADSSMRDSMQGALFGMKMDQAQQEKARQKAYEDMLFKMANPANPGQAAMGIDGAMGNTARPAFNGTPSMANAMAQPPAAPTGAIPPEMLALLQGMPAAQGTSALLSMQQDALKQARTPPVPQSFYDDQGREYKATYDPATQSWKKVGGSKSNLPPGMQMGPDGQVQSVPGYTNVLGANAGAEANARLPSQRSLAAYTSGLQTDSAIKVAKETDKLKAPGKIQETELKLSDDFNGSPVVKNYREASTAFMGIMDSASRDSKASDLNLVYGLAKLFDPGSVVREGETIMVQRTGGLSDQLMGFINSVNGGARLTPEIRSGIVAEARGRMEQQQNMYDAIASHFESVASQYGAKPENVIPMPAMRIVKDDADHAKLRPGQTYVGPDGQLRRRK